MMNRRSKYWASAAAVVIVGTIAVGAPAHASSTSYQQSSAMAEVVADQDLTAAPAVEDAPRGVVGVGKALYAGFKAATAPQAAANVARLASILGFAADTPRDSPEVEAAYFDR